MSVGDPSAGKAPLKKRKKGGCLKAFIITLCVTVGLLAILIVGGLFIGDAVMKSNVGVSLFDVFAVIGDVGDHDRDKIVTNGYDQDDVAAFYDSANSMLYFNTGDNAPLNSAYINELMKETVESGNTDNVMASLLGILDSKNFDADKLGAYDGWKDDVNHVDQLTPVTDKQFAAFFNDLIIESGIVDSMIPDVTSMLGNKQIKDLVDLEQLIIRKGADMAAEDLTRINGVAEHAYMTFTVSLSVKEAFNAALPTLDSQIGFPISMFGWFINWFLPDTTYATATVDLNDPAYGVNLELNALASAECEMGAAKEEIISKYRDADGKITKMDRLFIVAESFSNTDLRTTVNEASADMLGYLCESESGFSVANAIEMDTLKVKDNGDEFKIDLYGMMAGILNDQTGGNAAPEDIIVLMQALVCTDEAGSYGDDYAHRADLYAPMNADLDEALKSCGFDSIEDIKTADDYEKLKEKYGAIGYKTTGAELTGHENVYEEEFLDALAKTYCLDLNKYVSGVPTGERYTFSEIAGLFGIASGDGTTASVELIELLDGAKFAQSAGDPNVQKLQVTDRMLGAIMIALMPEFVNSSGYGDYGLELRTLKISQQTAGDGLPHDLVNVVFVLKTSEMLKAELVGYIGGVLPPYISMGIEVDMTPGLTAAQRLPAQITCYNEISELGNADVLNGLTSGRFVDALERIVPNINLDTLLSTMADGISSVVDNMTAVMPTFAFVPSTDDSVYYAEFPSMFEIAAQLLGLDDAAKPEADRISGEQLKNAIDYLVNYSYDGSADIAADANYDNFLSSVQQNYYLADQLSDYNSIFSSLTGEFDASVLRLNKAQSYTYGGNTSWYNGMMYDPRTADELAVTINGTDLVAIMREFAAASLGETAEILRADITAGGIDLYLRINVASMLEEKYRALINCDYIYAEISIDLNSVVGETNNKRYETVITVNGQTEVGKDFDTLMRLLRSFGAPSFDLDKIAGDVGISAYDALSKMNDAKIAYTLNADSDTIVLPSFYDYAMTLLEVDKTSYDASDMKAAIQGVRAQEVNTATDKYYVNADGSDAAANPFNFDAAAAVVNPIATSVDITKLEIVTENPNPLNNIVAALDNQFGWLIKDRATSRVGSLMQLSALAAGAKSGNAAATYAFANGYDGLLSENDNYVTLTFKTNIAELFAAGANLTGVLPDSVYMTIVYKYDTTTNAFTMEHLRVNGLTAKLQTLLIEEICKFGDFGTNVTDHSGDAEGMLSGYDFGIDATVPAGESACGRFTLAYGKLSTNA